jgi:sugar lactone lactonase YvrE
MNRREFVGFAATATASGAIAPRSLDKIKLRKAGKVETVFKSPGPKPNGLQATKEGLWIIDQGDNKAYLVAYRDGKVLREFATDADRASGITFDGETLWIGSTYNREIVRCDAKTGKTLARFFTPGAGVIYKTTWDPPGRSSPLLKPSRSSAEPVRPAQSSNSAPPNTTGTGAHGQEWRDGKLWMAVPPSRMIYRVNPETWVVEQQFPTAGNRPHGIGWEGRYLWCTDSNLNAFFKHDLVTGDIIEKIQLAESDPLPHGMSIWDGVLWYCDDVGVMCRFKM